MCFSPIPVLVSDYLIVTVCTCDDWFLQHDFTSVDFESMPAPLAYKMFKMKSQYPLHTAIKTKREDVVFLYLVEHDSQVFYLFFLLCLNVFCLQVPMSLKYQEYIGTKKTNGYIRNFSVTVANNLFLVLLWTLLYTASVMSWLQLLWSCRILGHLRWLWNRGSTVQSIEIHAWDFVNMFYPHYCSCACCCLLL